MSTETKAVQHTPGPWRIGDYDKILTADGEILYVEGGVRVAMAGYEDRREEFRANNRLIAAAPEMLEALKALCLWAALAHDADFEGRGDNHHMIQEWRYARAAIRKAEGTNERHS